MSVAPIVFYPWSADGRPVYVGVSQLFQTFPEQAVLLLLALWVVFYDFFRLVTGQLDDLSIASYVGYFQVERDTTLLRALQVAGAAQLQVGLGYAKSVVGLAHDVYAFARLGGQFVALSLIHI